MDRPVQCSVVRCPEFLCNKEFPDPSLDRASELSSVEPTRILDLKLDSTRHYGPENVQTQLIFLISFFRLGIRHMSS